MHTQYWLVVVRIYMMLIFIFFLSRFLFRSGNLEHPGDKLTDTTVEIFPSSHKHLVNLENNEPYQTAGLGYYVVSRFNSEGVAEGQIKEVMGPIKVLRLHCQAKSDSWAILSEVSMSDYKKHVNACIYETIKPCRWEQLSSAKRGWFCVCYKHDLVFEQQTFFLLSSQNHAEKQL